MSGVRVYDQKLMELGLTLPGFVERSRVFTSLLGLGLLSIAAYPPDHWDVEYREIDRVDDTQTQDILDNPPDLVAFSSLTVRINETYRLFMRFRNEGITVVIGGSHASAMPEAAMQ